MLFKGTGDKNWPKKEVQLSLAVNSSIDTIYWSCMPDAFIAEPFGNSEAVLLGVFRSKDKVAETPAKAWESVKRDFTNETCLDTCPWVVFPFLGSLTRNLRTVKGQQLSTSASCSKPFREASPINSSENTALICLDNILWGTALFVSLESMFRIYVLNPYGKSSLIRGPLCSADVALPLYSLLNVFLPFYPLSRDLY